MPEMGLLGFSICQILKKGMPDVFLACYETLTGYKEPTFPLWARYSDRSALHPTA